MILGIIFIIVGGFMLGVGIFNLHQFIPKRRMGGLVDQFGYGGVRVLYIIFGTVIMISGLTAVL